MKPRAVVLLSGGMDSSTLAYMVKEQGYSVHALAMHYGQRHRVELAYAKEIARGVGASYEVIDINPVVGRHLAGAESSLTNRNIEVPHGHYAAESMKSTVVPNRNALFLSIAVTIGAAQGVDMVATAVHAGDHAIYPDCRPEFVSAFARMTELSLGSLTPRIYAPFLNLRKEDIAAIGVKLGVPYEETWSCYEGGTFHCGKCGTCVERKEAFERSGFEDPTTYAA